MALALAASTAVALASVSLWLWLAGRRRVTVAPSVKPPLIHVGDFPLAESVDGNTHVRVYRTQPVFDAPSVHPTRWQRLRLLFVRGEWSPWDSGYRFYFKMMGGIMYVMRDEYRPTHWTAVYRYEIERVTKP